MRNRLCLLLSAIAFLSIAQSTQAQIATDGTTATQVNGNAIAPTGAGTVNGNNLYHSFSEFNVPQSGVIFNTGNSAVNGADVRNIINRVTGDNPSAILGTLESRQAFPNANLYLMNPNGIVFGQNARLDIGGSFHATTGTGLGFDSGTFSVDRNSLSFPSGDPKTIRFAVSQPAGIINQGNLAVDAGKSITFTGGSIINTGTLTAPSGNIALTAVAGNSLVELRSPDAVLGLQVTDNAVPTNWSGKITELPKLAELLTGKVPEANQVVVKADGSLALVAIPAATDIAVTNGMAIVSGRVDVSSPESKAGNIGIFGEKVGLVSAQIDASGALGGGTVLIGGNFQGNGIAPNALKTFVSSSSKIDVSALLNGNAGTAIVWADLNTRFLGSIIAKGGTQSGNGGFVEVSGKENLIFEGKVDVRAVNGNVGTLLLDPTDITISTAANTPTINFAGGVFSDVTTTPSNLNVTTLQNQLVLSNVTISTASGLGGLGDITINSPLTLTGTNSLTIQANNDINLNATIISPGGGGSLILNAGRDFNGGAQTISSSTRNILITAATGNITTGNIQTNISSDLNTNAGNITLNAPNGNITTADLGARVSLVVAGNAGNGGTISITSGGTINTGFLQSFSNALTGTAGNAGNITLINSTGNITTGQVIASANRAGNAGSVAITSAGNITTSSIDVRSENSVGNSGNAGNVTLSATGTISTSGQDINAFSNTTNNGSAGNGGIVILTGGVISGVPLVRSFSQRSGAGIGNTGNGGNITLTATNGDITGITLNSTSNSTSGNAGNGGNILINALNGNVTTGIINSTTNSTNPASTSGAITLQASGNITTGTNIDAGVTGNGNGGDISLTTTGGSINTTLGGIYSRNFIAGNSGNIRFQALGNITTNEVFSDVGSGNGGNISFITSGGFINTSLGEVNNSTGSSGNSGNILYSAAGNITTSNVMARATLSTGNGGNISLITTGGSINTLGAVYSYSIGGKGADILYQATGDITTGFNGVLSSSNGFNGGSISLSTTGGSINTSLGELNSVSVDGNGGDISINAPSGSVTTGNLYASTGSTNPASTSGAISLNAGLNLAINGTINNSAVAGKVGDLILGGNLALTADTTFSGNSGGTNGNLNLSNVNFTGNQTLTLDAGTGNISVGGIGNSSMPLTALNLIGANITLNRDIYTTNALTFDSPVTLTNSLAITSGSNITFGSTVNGNQALSLNVGSNTISFNGIVGGTAPLASLITNAASTITSTGSIDIRTIGTLNTGNITNAGRDISLKSSNAGITTGNLTSAATSQNGGNIIINAFSQITTGAIDSSSSTGTGGNVNLDPIGDVTITSANTSGAIQGGSFYAISTGSNIRILGFVSSPFAACAGASICTSGGTGGAISINHSGLNPFIVGDASINGSAGTITNGLYRLSLGQIIFNFPSTFRLDNISISPGGALPSTFTPITLVSITEAPFTPSPKTLAIITVDGTAILQSLIAKNEAYSSEKMSLANTQHDQASESLKAGNIAGALASLEDSYTSEIEAFTGKPITPSSSSVTGSDSGSTTSSTAGTTTTGSDSGSTTSSTTGTTTAGTTTGTTTGSDSSSTISTSTSSTSSSETRANNANANLQNTQKELNRVSQLTGSLTALVYPAIFNDRLEIVIILPNGKTVQKTIADSSKRVLLPIINDFRKNLLDVSSEKYLIQSQKLHDWLVKPIESTLQAEKISTLVFVMDGDLRVIPPAALHDGKKFLIEKYAVASVSSMRLTKLETRDRKNSRVLAMGLTEAREGFSALPSVNAEIGNIVGTSNAQSLLSGMSFINEPFTIPNMQAERKQQDYGIIHLATHARFLTNSAYGSFIQFYNNRLYISDIPDLKFNKPQVEILTLSACETAVGNNLGIAGLAVTSGVRSVLASLWPVSDTGTVPLMLSFYSQISAAPSKALALQKAQLSLINGKVKIENDKIIGIQGIPAVPLPANSSINIKHPFFWSSFILVGSWL